MTQRLTTVMMTLVLTALPGVALAQEHEGTALSPFAGNVGNALWTLLIFVLVVVVLGKFAWGPILGTLKARETFIHDALGAAKRDRDAAEASLKEYSEKLRAARVEADAILSQSRADGERLLESMRQKAKAEAESIVQNAERRIEQEARRALQQIRQEAADISVDIASKLIRRNLSKEDNQQLIEEALRQVETKSH